MCFSMPSDNEAPTVVKDVAPGGKKQPRLHNTRNEKSDKSEYGVIYI